MAQPLPTWAGVTLGGDPRRVKVKPAMHADSACPRSRWITAHPDTRVLPPRRKGASPHFPLGAVLDLTVAAATRAELQAPTARAAWLRQQAKSAHPRHRSYIEQAVEALLDLFSALNETDGPYTIRDTNLSWTGARGGSLTTWGLNLEGPEGLREAWHLRVGSARPAAGSDAMSAVQTAKVLREQVWSDPCRRVRVRDVGAADGTATTWVDATTVEVDHAYDNALRPALMTLLDPAPAPVPGFACARCDVAHSCESLPRVDGALGQKQSTSWRRSVSATDLERYARCPAAWHYRYEMHLPHDEVGSDALVRGAAVQEWLKARHSRGVPCTPADLADHAGLDLEAFQSAVPYLTNHIDRCPLTAPGTRVIVNDETLHCYDQMADIVVVTKPDLLLSRGQTLVIRETKSSATVSAAATRSEISSRYLQVHLGLVLAEALAAAYGCTEALMELELLTPAGAQVWSWRTSAPVEMQVAKDDVSQRVQNWLADTSWDPRPSPICAYCDVASWCDVADAYAAGVASPPPSGPACGSAWSPVDPF